MSEGYFMPGEPVRTPTQREWDAAEALIEETAKRHDGFYLGDFEVDADREETTGAEVALSVDLGKIQADIAVPTLANRLRAFAEHLDQAVARAEQREAVA